MLVERSMHPEWLSNAYLIADRPGGRGVLIDSGAPAEPLLEVIERHDLTVEKLLLTHHHHDHVAENALLKRRLGLEILAHPLEADLLEDVDRRLLPGESVTVGDLELEPLHTPGHTAGMLSFRVGNAEVFTGDTLFRRSVGGVRAPGSTSFEDLKRSVMEVLMRLPPQITVRPGHTDPSTIGEEWEQNAFVRVWRGLEPEGDERCRVGEEEATLVLFAPDYDGGHKAWVRWADSGRDDIVPGSIVVRGDDAAAERTTPSA